MFRNLVAFLFAVSAIFFSGNMAMAEDPGQLTVAELAANAGDYVGKTVRTGGMVTHVCKHGGKRMFIIGDEPEPSFKITAGQSVGAFDRALEGSDVIVYGVVQELKVDAAYLDEWEAGLDEDQKPEAAHEGDHEGDEEEDHNAESRQQIATLRQRLAESGKEALSFYSLECQNYIEEESGV